MQRCVLSTLLFFLVTAAVIPQSASASILASSTFDTDADGWFNTVQQNDPLKQNFTWQSTGGNTSVDNSDGYFQFSDIFNDPGANRFEAPSKFLGDWSGLDNGAGTFSYDIKIFDVNVGQGTSKVPYTLFLSGAGGSAEWNGATPQGITGWVTNEISIDESNFDVTSGTWQGLLNNVSSLKIRAEHFGNNLDPPTELSGIDNIYLEGPAGSFNAIPEPASFTVWFLGAAAAGFVGSRKRRSKVKASSERAV